MFEGQIVHYDEIRVDLGATAGGSADAAFDGLASYGGGGQIVGLFTPDYIALALGYRIFATSQLGGSPYTHVVLDVPALGVGGTWDATSGTSDLACVLRFFGVTLTVEATATWRLDLERVTFSGPAGASRDVTGNWSLQSGMTLTPCSVPIFGMPPELNAASFTDPVPGDDPIYPPGFPPGGGASIAGEGTASGRLRAFVGGDAVLDVGGSAYSTVYGNGNSSGGGTGRTEVLMPGGEAGVVRMESPYQGVVYRGGFPGALKRVTDMTSTRPSDSGWGSDVVTVTDTPLVAPRSEFLGVVREGPHAIEEPLSFACPRPYTQGESEWHAGTSTVTRTSHAEAFPIAIDVGDTLGYLTHAEPIVPFYNCWVNRLWGFMMWTPPDGASDGDAWKALGGPQGADGYWLPIRQQVSRHSALPETDATQERSDVLTEALSQNGLAGLMAGQVFGRATSWWGVPDFTPLPLAPPGFLYSSASASLWSAEEGGPSLAFGPSGVTATGEGKVYLDLGSWSGQLAMLPRLAKSLTLGWTALGAGASVSVYAEGLDGERALLASTPGTVALPRMAANKKTGSWRLDFGGLSESDVGISTPATADASLRMATDAEAALSTLSPKAGAWARLCFEVDPGDAAAVLLAYPSSAATDLTNAKAVRESGQWASFVTENGPIVRFSGLFWDPFSDALLDEPLTPSYGCPTAWDALAWRQSVTKGVRALDDPAALARESGWVEGKEWISPKHLARDPFDQAQVTTAFVAAAADGKPLPCVVNTYRSVPPMGLWPRPKRDKAHDWGPNGGWGLQSYSLCSPVRSVVGVSGSSPSIGLPTGRAWISDAALSLPAGWEGRAYRLAVDGDEDADWALRVASKQLATARPYRGFLLIDGLAPAGAKNPHLCAKADGRVYLAYGQGAQLRCREWWNGGIGPHRHDSEIAPDGFRPRLAADPRNGALVVHYEREGAMLQRTSKDGGRTWTPETDMGYGYRPEPAPSPLGALVRLRLEHDSGTRYVVKAAHRTDAPGIVWSAETTVTDQGGEALACELEGWGGIVAPWDRSGAWVLAIVPYGESAIATYRSKQRHALTFKRLP